MRERGIGRELKGSLAYALRLRVFAFPVPDGTGIDCSALRAKNARRKNSHVVWQCRISRETIDDSRSNLIPVLNADRAHKCAE